MLRDLNYCKKNKSICFNTKCKLAEKSNFQFDDKAEFPLKYLEVVASDGSTNPIKSIIVCCMNPEY